MQAQKKTQKKNTLLFQDKAKTTVELIFEFFNRPIFLVNYSIY